MTRVRTVAFTLAFVLLPASSAVAQVTTPPKFVGRLVGIYDDRSGEPIDSAEVRDLATGSFALTTSTGTLSLFFVDTAGGLLRIRKVGYTPLTLFVDNSPGESAPLTITLQPLAQRLPTVITRDSAPNYMSKFLRDYEERRKTGSGHFIPESVMRRFEHRTLGSLVESYVPGVNVVEGRGGIAIATSSRGQKSSQPCPIDVYLDGIYVSANATAGGATIFNPNPQTARTTRPREQQGDRGYFNPANNLNQWGVNTLAAAEYHNAANTPIEYMRTGAGCGVLLLWTRER